ncbi:unnamed protein product [Brachionus calyciflorus]|uniref:Uncharacterized protein n=1 Tax=Brachionus calyciflorus TaxID=104777 RepID=A0A814PRI2_9BILA|nr:unnamed protein product [Brachionus calyciflorus]
MEEQFMDSIQMEEQSVYSFNHLEANHLKIYTDALNEVFELNKSTEQINAKIVTLNRKRSAISQKLNTIKTYGLKTFGSKAYYPQVTFIPVTTKEEFAELQSQTTLTPVIQKRTFAIIDVTSDEEIANFSKNIKFLFLIEITPIPKQKPIAFESVPCRINLPASPNNIVLNVISTKRATNVNCLKKN